MKHFFLFSCLFFLTKTIYSQEISLKYGNITEDELKMTTYDQDTSAVAVVIYEHGNLAYERDQTKGLFIKFEVKKKIKILKSEGTYRGDVGIPYLKSLRESVLGIEAYAYNMENGKLVKTKLPKKYIFDDAILNQFRLKKFSIPNVKAGTVIEYKYTITSEGIFNIPTWYMQDDIPIMNSTLEITIPEFFVFSVDAAKGFEHINVEQSYVTQILNIGYSRTITSHSKKYNFSAQNIPAMKNEPFVWCLKDFTSGVRFELQSIKSIDGYHKSFTSTWEELEKTLRDDSRFGSNLKFTNPYKSETKEIVSSVTDEEERISKIYDLIKNKIRWNDTYSFYGNESKNAVKKGVGNNAQINIVLISALKDAGIKVYPILISRRSFGRIPYTHPSINQLNTFLVCAETYDGKRFYMDGSATHGGLNMLPTTLLVDRGYIFNENVKEKWVNLTGITKNQQIVSQVIKSDENGQLTCERTTRYTNQIAYQVKPRYKSSEDSLKYVEKLQSEKNIKIEELIVEGTDNISFKVDEKMKITYNQDNNAEYLYINPLVFEPVENPFKQSDRKLPIEFDYPYSYTVRTMLMMPENYIIEEIPEMVEIEMDDDSGFCRFLIGQNENGVQVSFHFELNQIIFPSSDYEMLREFFGIVATKCSELIVLKKDINN
ncbi:MAG: DUF3857 domain-containing protein [Marinilabiliaceae bacterium]|nr:DUF3857 domain-containing protein [Marinilabiliaceae bacterium]